LVRVLVNRQHQPGDPLATHSSCLVQSSCLVPSRNNHQWTRQSASAGEHQMLSLEEEAMELRDWQEVGFQTLHTTHSNIISVWGSWYKLT